MPSKIVVNCETGAIEQVELTTEEIAQMKADAEAYSAQKAEEEAEKAELETKKESGKAKLKELGLTDAEIQALIK